ncbi:Uncharacterised protein [uncultured archaeon]|nr:Uncharacterised protein [uncultured archaeon]
MKKTRGVKKKVSSHKKQNKFLLSFKRFFPLILLVAVFSILVLDATHSTGNVITGNADLGTSSSNTGGISPTIGAGTSFISDLFTQWSAGQLDVNIAKYLFWLMLTGLIWGALSFAKFPPSGVFQALIAIPVSFLATAYITPTEVFTILTSYTALGITLTFILPFIILLFVSAMLLSNEKIRQMSIPKIMMEVFLWIFYMVVLGYKLIAGLISGQIQLGLTLPIIIMMAVFLISLLIVVFNSKFRNWMWKIGNDIRRAQAEAARVEAEESMRTAERVERSREGR